MVAKQLHSLQSEPPEGIKVFINDGDLTDIQATIEGPCTFVNNLNITLFCSSLPIMPFVFIYLYRKMFSVLLQGRYFFYFSWDTL